MKRIYTILFAAVALVSCIENDLPKPTVDLYIASLEVEGTNGDIVIDRSTYTATIPLAEETNIEAVQFKTITFGSDVITNVNFEADNSKIVVSEDLNGAIVNMTDTEYLYLSYFQTYEWKIVATQEINRICFRQALHQWFQLFLQATPKYIFHSSPSIHREIQTRQGGIKIHMILIIAYPIIPHSVIQILFHHRFTQSW